MVRSRAYSKAGVKNEQLQIRLEGGDTARECSVLVLQPAGTAELGMRVPSTQDPGCGLLEAL